MNPEQMTDTELQQAIDHTWEWWFRRKRNGHCSAHNDYHRLQELRAEAQRRADDDHRDVHAP